MVAIAINHLLDAALQYADLGYSVFPCRPNDKAPATPNGYKDATTDAEQIERWWSQTPNANVAIAAEGLLVIDIDGKDNRWPHDPAKQNDLLAGQQSMTPRGGRHFIFRQPAGKSFKNTTSKIAPRVDTRAGGGYIVVAPSQIAGKPYKWNKGMALDIPPDALSEPPTWLLEILEGPSNSSVRSDQHKDANQIPDGQRNAVLASLGGNVRRVGSTYHEILAYLQAVNSGRCQPPLSPAEVDKIAWSVSRYEPDQIATAVVEHHAGATDLGTAGSTDPYIPFPVATLPEPVRAFVAAGSEAIGSDASYIAMPLLTALVLQRPLN